MNVHENARMTPAGRELLAQRIEGGWTVMRAATAAGISTRTAAKWLARHRLGGERRHYDRSSAPKRCPHAIPPERIARIEALRRQRMTGAQIAIQLCMARSTVGAILRRLGLGRLDALEPTPPVQRYEYDAPGGMIHIDMKKHGRIERSGHPITGDRTSQRKTCGIGRGLPDEKKETACAFTSRACANGLTQRRIDHPPTGPAPSSSGPFGARQTRCRDQHQGRRDCDGDRAHGHAEPERPLFELLPDIGRHRMRANWR